MIKKQSKEAAYTERELKNALEMALAIIYSWAIDGHADWCESNSDGKCTCGHEQAAQFVKEDRRLKDG